MAKSMSTIAENHRARAAAADAATRVDEAYALYKKGDKMAMSKIANLSPEELRKLPDEAFKKIAEMASDGSTGSFVDPAHVGDQKDGQTQVGETVQLGSPNQPRGDTSPGGTGQPPSVEVPPPAETPQQVEPEKMASIQGLIAKHTAIGYRNAIVKVGKLIEKRAEQKKAEVEDEANLDRVLQGMTARYGEEKVAQFVAATYAEAQQKLAQKLISSERSR